jgi:hypothetical protein
MISIVLNGRLGNQMFQYSICRIVAEKNNFNFYIPEKGSKSTEGVHLKNYFPNLDMGIKDGEIMNSYTEDHTIQKFNDEIFNVPDFTEISGFFQSPLYFSGYEEKIRSWFEIEIDEKTKSILDQYNPKDYCYVHIRGLDYKNHEHWFLEKDYYVKSMEYIKSIKSDISFIFITDDPGEPLKWFPNIKYMKNDMMVDFNLLLHSKYLIIPNSTFSWWPAFLDPKKIVIAPNNWLNYNKPELGFYPVDIKTTNFKYI